jgi:hypothetical protein
LAVFDVSNPANPRQVRGYDTSGFARGVAVSGNYAYVADYDAGLQVIDVRAPTNSVRVGGYDTSGRRAWRCPGITPTWQITVRLQVIGVTRQLRGRRRHWLGGQAWSVGVYACMAIEAGLAVIDVATPPTACGGRP